MNIEQDKFYRTSDGRKVGPMMASGFPHWPWIVVRGNGKCWNDDGSEVKGTNSGDIIAEWTDEPETGTLAELNVKPGDVVQVVGGKSWEIVGVDDAGNYLINDAPARHLSNTLPFRMIARASRPEAPPLWCDMTPEEKGALLLAEYEGPNFCIEYQLPGDDGWGQKHKTEAYIDDWAYRIRPPEPKRETMTLYGGGYGSGSSIWMNGRRGERHDTHSITLPLIDGKPPTGTFTNDQGETITVEGIEP